MSDPYNLNRFVSGQDGVYEDVCRELERGRKTSHWIWFIFPQLKGLGYSRNSEFYGLASRDEAKAYIEHPLLGPRLLHCTELVNRVRGQALYEILGEVDAVKFRSCMTLFAIAAPQHAVFEAALVKYFAGERDAQTLALVGV